ncbi:hypothetical protein [Neobacillus terrae]|uniref:hypothetical protein n=1 Tax=Neobacillus terrae TaxID=3034837 RepID=UPI00140A5D72|nr:hypothetical protein [Neobacillus terrae]NHM30855.1 hypothetical protein [Neobacillus terrae]
MKRILILPFIIVILGSLLLGCSDHPSKEQKITKVTNVKYNEITKIVFYDGRGRNKPVTIDNHKQVNDFIQMVDHYIVKEEKDHEPSVGWIHNAVFYSGSKKIMDITFTNPLKIDGKYYVIVKGKLSTEGIDHFISSANPNWKN